MSVSLRLYRASDLPILQDWYNNIDAFSYATGNHSLAVSLPKFVSDNPGIRMICVDDGKVIGIIVASQKELLREKILWITLLMVDEKEQRKGYGTVALDRLYGLCGYGTLIKKVLVAVDPENKRGLAFWTAKGYQIMNNQWCKDMGLMKEVVILQLGPGL